MAKKQKHFRTRRAILDHLKQEGPLTTQDLAVRLDFTEMAVRQHLADLEKEKLVTVGERQRPLGRPAKLWQLTQAADKFFPDGHAELTAGLLTAMRAAFGEDGLQSLLHVRATQQATIYRAAMGAATTLEKRLDRLAQLRSDEGYMAELHRDGDGGFLLVEHHCPICVAARTCSGLCQAELDLFQEVLGDTVMVTRTDHILAGAVRCAYRITRQKKDRRP